jgi:methyl-accepting chemotaxis protein
MLDLFNSIKSHLDEVASAVSEVTRRISEYQRQIAELKPVADSLTSIVEQVNAKKAELTDFETKLKAAQAQHKRLLETLQQV